MSKQRVAHILCLMCVFASPLVAAEEQIRRVQNLSFTDVLVLGDIDVEITQGSDTTLEMRGDAQDLDTQPFYVRNNTLVLGFRNNDRAARKNAGETPLRFRVTVPGLAKLQLKGPGRVFIRPFDFQEPGGDLFDNKAPVLVLEGSGQISAFALQGAELEVRVEGSGDVRIVALDVSVIEAVVAGRGSVFIESLQATEAEFTITGSGDVHVTGEGVAETLEANVIGSGNIRVPGVRSLRVESNIVGSGSASLGEIRDQLNASILGSGDIVYAGTPELERVELGSGEVRRRD